MIFFKGLLKNNMDLDSSNINNSWNKLSPTSVDKILVIILLAYPIYKGITLLTLKTTATVFELLLFDFIALILLLPLLFIHELLHAIGFSKNQQINIYFKNFGLITHCTEVVNKKRFLFILLLPNIILSLTASLLLIFPLSIDAIYLKVISFPLLILVIGSYNDLIIVSNILRNYNKIKVIKLNGPFIFYQGFVNK